MRSARRVENPCTARELGDGRATSPRRGCRTAPAAGGGAWRRCPWNVQQLGGDGPLPAPLPAVGDAEPMCLVARALQQPQRRAPPRKPEALGATRAGRPLPPAWRGSRSAPRPCPSASRRLDGGAELSLAAVDDDEVGQRQRLVPPARQVAGDHFVDGGEVVLLPQPADPELAILALLRAPRLEPDQRPHGVAPLVVARCRRRPGSAAPRSARGRGPARRPDLRPVLRSRRTRSAGSRAGAARSARPARASDARCRAAASPSRCPVAARPAVSSSRRRERQHHPPRPRLGRHVVPDQERPQHLGVLLLLDVLEEACSRPTTLPVPHPQQDADGVIAVPGVTDHVRVAAAERSPPPAGSSSRSSHLSASRMLACALEVLALARGRHQLPHPVPDVDACAPRGSRAPRRSSPGSPPRSASPRTGAWQRPM